MATLMSGLLAIGMGRGWIRLADCAKSLMDKPQLECKQHQGSVSCVALSGFGQLATTSYDGSVKLVDTHTGVERVLCSREISEEMFELGLEEAEAGPVNLRGHTDAVTAAAFSPCGSYLATVGWDEQLIIWNVATGEADASLLGAQCGRLRCVAFSPLGTSICSGGDHAIIVWCADSGDIRTVLQTATPCTISVVFLDEHRVLGACTDGAIRLWCSNAVDDTENDANADEWKAQLLYKDDGSLGRVVFSGWRWEGGVRAGTLAACTDQGIRIVDAVSWSASGLIRSHGHGGRCICQDGEPIERCPVQGHDGAVHALAFSPCGGLLASGGQDGRLRVWDVASPAMELREVAPIGLVLQTLAWAKDWRPERRLAFALVLAPRTEGASLAALLEPGIVKLILDLAT